MWFCVWGFLLFLVYTDIKPIEIIIVLSSTTKKEEQHLVLDYNEHYNAVISIVIREINDTQVSFAINCQDLLDIFFLGFQLRLPMSLIHVYYPH